MTTSALHIHSQVPVLAELERIALWTATELLGFKKELHVTVSLQTKGTARTRLGHFAKGRWTLDALEKLGVCELSVSSEGLQRGPMEVAETVIHEMVHGYCESEGIVDTSKGGNHNSKFRAEAERIGLVVDKGTQGWNQTAMSTELNAKVYEVLDAGVFQMWRNENPRKEKSVQVKRVAYQCKCQTEGYEGEEYGKQYRIMVPAKADFNAMCRFCGHGYDEVTR